jgi:starch synthase
MKAGIAYSDAITTVSETYAREIQTSQFGYGLEGLLKHRDIDLFGILNGADYSDWNPAADPHTYGINYDLKSFHKKEEIKNRLCDELRLFRGSEPVVGIVSRLVSQKGFETLSHVFHKIMELPLKFAILGTGQPEIENFFLEMTSIYPGRVSANITFNNAMSHKIEAGSDIFLMPSVYEPCGLNQIYSLRYGTIPVVRSTGGLADTIIDFNSNPQQGNGFSYYDPHGDYLADALKRAVETYFQPLTWMKIVENAMKTNFSWEISAKKYEQVYYSRLH